MTDSTAPILDLAAAPEVPTVAELSEAMGAVADRLASLHRLTFETVAALSEVVRTGICETLHGLPLDHWLRLHANLINADAAMLVTAADVLPQMPTTWLLFRRGVISWGTARNLAEKLARRSHAERSVIDERISATQDDWGEDLDGWSGNRLLDEIDRAIDELDDLRELHRREDREPTASYLAVQPSLDGRVRGFFDLDPLGGATFVRGLDAATPDGAAKDRGERRAAGLVAMAASYLGGDRDGRVAKPLVTVVVQLADVTAHAAGHLEIGVPGVLPTLSARLVELLASEADLQAVICDGYRPLATTAKRRAEHISEATRVALRANSMGDRMPASDLLHQHDHHIVHREDGGDHDPDNLIGLSARSHQLIHRHGWTGHLDPASGVFSITRNGTTWSSIPRTTPLSRP